MKTNIFMAIISITAVVLTSAANAAYWDCEVSIYKNGFWGWNSTGNRITIEVEANSRSQAESKVLNKRTTATVGLGSTIKVCPSNDFEGCKYRTENPDCRRQ